jgi:hypothetical protein
LSKLEQDLAPGRGHVIWLWEGESSEQANAAAGVEAGDNDMVIFLQHYAFLVPIKRPRLISELEARS